MTLETSFLAAAIALSFSGNADSPGSVARQVVNGNGFQSSLGRQSIVSANVSSLIVDGGQYRARLTVDHVYFSAMDHPVRIGDELSFWGILSGGSNAGLPSFIPPLKSGEQIMCVLIRDKTERTLELASYRIGLGLPVPLGFGFVPWEPSRKQKGPELDFAEGIERVAALPVKKQEQLLNEFALGKNQYLSAWALAVLWTEDKTNARRQIESWLADSRFASKETADKARKLIESRAMAYPQTRQE